MAAANDGLHSRIARLQGLASRTEAAERGILRQAEKMLDDLAGKITDVSKAANLGDPDAEATYQQLVLDRGKLNIIIARARAALEE